MRDYQEIILKFVKIVERYPEIYDSSHNVYRTRYAELAWDKIADCVRAEMNEECTVDEIKLKWKGIRSSFNRFRKKITRSKSETPPCKKYYLYDSLQFLEPFTKVKTLPKEMRDVLYGQNISEEYLNTDDDDSTRDEFATEYLDSWDVTVKSEAVDDDEDILNTNDVLGIDLEEEVSDNKIQDPNTEVMISDTNAKTADKVKKRKIEDTADTTDSEDLQFFKSILPDIKDFSVKEKRKLKMGILKLIDEIEDSRSNKACP